MFFTLSKTDTKSKARAGEITTAHGKIETPTFMPVGTVGSVKGLHFKDLKEDVNPDIILGNTYHLYLRPGTEIIEQAGGLHKFIGWDRPMLTDSGGYQVYSLTDIRKMNPEGVIFNRTLTAQNIFLLPKELWIFSEVLALISLWLLMNVRLIPATMIMQKSRCTSPTTGLDAASTGLIETEAKYGYDQHFFPIVQGSTFRDLRIQSAEAIAAHGAEGNAIGGLVCW